MICMEKVAIEVFSGPMDGQRLKFPAGIDRITIGRMEGKIVILPDGYVSRDHAQITYENGKYWLEDTSRHGTFIDDKKIDKKVELSVGTVLKVGNTLLKFDKVLVQEEIFDLICKFYIITKDMKSSELKNMMQHPEVRDIEKEFNNSSNLIDFKNIFEKYLETIYRILEKVEPKKLEPIPSCPVPTRQEAEIMKVQDFLSLKNVMISRYEERFGAE